MTVETTVRQIRDDVRRGERRAEDVCRASLDRLHAVNDRLNAFLTVDDEGALAEARRVDASAERATLPLAGVPIAVKDNISTRGLRTTAGSRILQRYVPPYDATVVERLRAAGAVVIGKTNCDEFAMGSSNENSAFGAVANPWAIDRAPGGSSGGSAAAVAARIVPAALGSDTGGSVRQPAAFCGVVGLKPTYGCVSRYGLIAFGSSLDQVGPLGRTVDDAALLFEAMAGRDPRDSTSSDPPAGAGPVAWREATAEGRLVLGVPRRLILEGVDAAVGAAFDAALDTLSQLGATIVDVELPHAHHAIPVYYLVATAEASSNLARYDGVRYTRRAALRAGEGLEEMYDRTRDEGFGAEVKRRIVLGTYVLSAGYYEAYYLRAQQVRTLIRRDYEAALNRTSAVVLPTTPSAAFRLGEKVDDPLQMYLADVFTVSANLAGVPAVSVPCGFSPDGLPIGLQIIGKPWGEASILAIARAYEHATAWHTASPPVMQRSPERASRSDRL